MATKQPDWPTGDEADEALPPVAPPAAQSPAKPATPDTAPVIAPAAMQPGWTGGNVGKVTATPQVKSLHPADDDEGESDEALPPAKSTKFALPSPLPKTYAECYALHQKLLATPATTQSEYETRSKSLQIFGEHFHRIQQGPIAPDIGSLTYGKSAVKHNEILTSQRREMVASGDMVVRDLLEDFKSLENRIKVLREELALMAKENHELKELLATAK